jgi:hypothetical protein
MACCVSHYRFHYCDLKPVRVILLSGCHSLPCQLVSRAGAEIPGLVPSRSGSRKTFGFEDIALIVTCMQKKDFSHMRPRLQHFHLVHRL